MALRYLSWLLNAGEFYCLRCWRWHPGAVSASIAAVVTIGTAGATLAHFNQYIVDASQEVRQIAAQGSFAPAASLPQVVGNADLPVFDSAGFILEFHSIAKDVGLASDEVSYVLENSASQPYQRYRISMEVKSGYLGVRRFIAALSAALPNVTLDTLRCRRESAGGGALVCQLAFSAFFSKEKHG